MGINKIHTFFAASPLWQNGGLFVVRIITGGFLAYHGWEIFDTTKMNEYLQWEMFRNKPSIKTMLYAGKLFELIGGLLLAAGMFTRIASLLIVGTLGYIAFFIGHGKVWYEDQHPFLFVLLAMTFFFTGPGTISVDGMKKKKNNKYF